MPIDRNNLASTFARSPDPMQKNKQDGEKIFITYRADRTIDLKNGKIVLNLVYKDLTQEVVTFQIKHNFGMFSFCIVGDKFQKSKGI